MNDSRLRSDVARVIVGEPDAVVLLAWRGTTQISVYGQRRWHWPHRRARGGLPRMSLLVVQGDRVAVLGAIPRWGGVQPGRVLQVWRRSDVAVSWSPSHPAHLVELAVASHGIAARLEAPNAGIPDGQAAELDRLCALVGPAPPAVQ